MRNIKMVVWERKIAYMQAQAIVERETTRQMLLEAEFEAARAALRDGTQQQKRESASAGIETAESLKEQQEGASNAAEADATLEGEEGEKPFIKPTREMLNRVDAELQRQFPVPVHLIGRPRAEKRREVVKLKSEKQGGLKFGRSKKKGTRWFIV
jgi:hypothetical protein